MPATSQRSEPMPAAGTRAPRSLLADITLDYGPRGLFGDFFPKAVAAAEHQGVTLSFVQYPCKSGWPSGVRGGVQATALTGAEDAVARWPASADGGSATTASEAAQAANGAKTARFIEASVCVCRC